MAVNYLTLRSTMLYNTPGGTSIPSGYMNVVGTNGINTLWTNSVALHDTTFSTLTGSTITSVSSIGIGTSNPNYTLDVSGSSHLTGTLAVGIGSTSDNYNQIQMIYTNVGTGSTSNYGSLQLNGSSNTICWTGTGNVGIGTINTSSYVLDVAGSGRFISNTSGGDDISVISANNIGISAPSVIYAGTYSWIGLTVSTTGKFQMAATASYIYYSSNYGKTWSQISYPNASDLNTSVAGAMMSRDGSTLVVAKNGYSQATYYRSYDLGNSWSTTNCYSNTTSVSAMAMSAAGDPSNAVIYTSFIQSGSCYIFEYNLLKAGTSSWNQRDLTSLTTVTSMCCSTDGALSFVSVAGQGVINYGSNYQSPFYYGFHNFYASNSPSASWVSICCSSSGAIQYAVTSSTLYTSVNTGVTWTQIMITFTGISSISCSYDGTIVYAACSAGIYFSTNSGTSWLLLTSSNWKLIAMSQYSLYVTAGQVSGALYSLNNVSPIALNVSGRVGIGTAAPVGSLHVYNSNASFTGAPTVIIGDGQVDAGGTYGMLQLVRANNGADNKAHLAFIKNGLTIFGMGYYPGASQSAFGLVPSFGTMATNTGLWMTTGGNVGIGTSSPTGDFHVHMPSAAGGWQTFKVKPTSFWGDGCSVRSETAGTLYGTLFDIMMSNPHVCTASTGNATIRMGRGGGISSGRWWEIGTLSSNKFRIGIEATDTGININTSGQVGINNASPSYTLDVNGTMRVYGAGDNTYTTYFPNGGTWNATLNVGSGTDRGTAQVLTTNGNLHLDAAPGYTMYYGHYANYRGSANSHQFYGSATFNSNLTGNEVYANSWLRVNGTGGVYWQSYGRGIQSADTGGASYGNISTYGSGINGWQGYNINGRFTYMATGESWGIHDSVNGWGINGYANTRVGIHNYVDQYSATFNIYTDNYIYYGGQPSNCSEAIRITAPYSGFWSIGIQDGYNCNMYFAANTNYNGQAVCGYIENDNYGTYKLNFTGQHRCVYDETINKTDSEGLVVQASGQLYSLLIDSFDNTSQIDHITIDEALPQVTLTSTAYCPSVFGVVSYTEDTNNTRVGGIGRFMSVYYNPSGEKHRVFINSIGEGAIWVCSQSGAFTNGDYITSSDVPGYGMKQNDGVMMNYTIGKITIDCDFTAPQMPIKVIKKKPTALQKVPVTVEEEVEQINNVIEFDESTNRYVERKKITMKTQTTIVQDEFDVYSEDGKVIGKHKVQRFNYVQGFENDLDANGMIKWIDSSETKPAYKIRYLRSDGTIISKEVYNTALANGETVYIAAFVSCTYHCG